MLRKNRVAIISKNQTLIRFFQLEATFCGCSVQIFAEPPATMNEFDRVVLDVAAGYCAAEDPACQIAAVLTEAREKPPLPVNCVWEWPVSVEEAHIFFEGYTAIREEETPREESPAIYVLSEEQRQILYRNRTIELPPHAWRVLTCLGENAGSTVPREILDEEIGEERGNMTDVYIHHLRKRLEEPYGIRVISTVRGVGYRLDTRWIRMNES